MRSHGQATKQTAARASEDRTKAGAGGTLPAAARANQRVRARIITNNGDGSYGVQLWQGDGTLDTDTTIKCWAWPDTSALEAATDCYVQYEIGSPIPMIDATGGSGSSSGSSITVGAPGFLSGT